MKLIQLLILCFLIIFAAVSIAYYLSQIVTIQTVVMPSKLNVDTVIGLTTENNILSFGKMPPESSSSRTLAITNPYAYPVAFSLLFDAPYADWVSLNVTSGIIEGYQNLTFYVTADVPANITPANYTGTLTLALYQRRFVVAKEKMASLFST